MRLLQDPEYLSSPLFRLVNNLIPNKALGENGDYLPTGNQIGEKITVVSLLPYATNKTNCSISSSTTTHPGSVTLAVS